MARPKIDDPKNRRKILAVSAKIFAKKGFDATRVDDIAIQARVNKALIYYYFQNKDAILKEIIKIFVAKCIDNSIAETGNIENILSDKSIHEFFHSNIQFLEQNRDILRIMIMESLKKTKRVPHLIEAIRMPNDSLRGIRSKEILHQMRIKGINIEEDIQKALVNEFFTKSVPIMFFVLFHEAWAEHFKIPDANLKEWFIEAIEATHVAYHRLVSSNKNRENGNGQ